jgi:uncharacterized protein with NRDE domain
MCLIIVEFQTEPLTPLVVAANRDEKLERPAVTATVLRERDPRVIGGRDLLAGGTWLAVNEHGVVAGLTNRPSQAGRDPSKRSRGELPVALASHESAKAAVDDFVIRFHPGDFNLAWLLVGDRHTLYYLGMGEGEGVEVEALEPGIHVLGNGPLNEPSPKTDLVRDRLARAPRNEDPGSFLWLRSVLADHSIPAAIAADPPPERAQELYAPCVHTEGYGTRSAVLLTVPAEPGLPTVRVADGPPCRTPLLAIDDLWGSSPHLADGLGRTSP